jgi:hypothetical protein
MIFVGIACPVCDICLILALGTSRLSFDFTFDPVLPTVFLDFDCSTGNSLNSESLQGAGSEEESGRDVGNLETTAVESVLFAVRFRDGFVILFCAVCWGP